MTSDIKILTTVISFITKNVLSEMISSRYYIESVRSHDGNCTLLSMFPSHVSDFKLQLSGYSFISSLHCSRVSFSCSILPWFGSPLFRHFLHRLPHFTLCGNSFGDAPFGLSRNSCHQQTSVLHIPSQSIHCKRMFS